MASPGGTAYPDYILWCKKSYDHIMHTPNIPSASINPIIVTIINAIATATTMN